jgi:hypothetical protein
MDLKLLINRVLYKIKNPFEVNNLFWLIIVSLNLYVLYTSIIHYDWLYAFIAVIFLYYSTKDLFR